MSIFLLKNPNCVLIHIPKTGGTSIRKGAWNGRYEGPEFCRVPVEWEHYFKFAFVRHPLDRFISAFMMFTQGAVGDPAWRLPHDARPLSISEFAKIAFDDRIVYDERRATFEEKIRHHTIQQTHPFNLLQSAEFVGRYECFSSDFGKIARIVGLDAQLPHMHFTRHRGWEEYLSGDLLSQCIEFYRDDFLQLGYERP